MTGEEGPKVEEQQDDPLVQATIDSLIMQRNKAQNECAEYMARGQVMSVQLAEVKEEVVRLRKEIQDGKPKKQ